MAGKVDISKLAERLAQLNNDSNRGSGSSMNFLNIKDGRNVIRILPPKEGADSFYEEVWVHYGVGKTDQNKKGTMVVCPTTHGDNKPCPVCELSSELKKLSKKKDDSYDKQAKSVYRKKRVYYNAISRDEDLSVYELQGEGEDAKWINTATGDEDSPIKVLGTGVGIFKDILGLIVDPEYGDITDPEQGLDLIITKSGSGQFNTNYDVKTVRKESVAIPEDAPQDILNNWEKMLVDLKPLTKAKTYDELSAIMDGEDGSEAPTDSEVEEGMDNLSDKGTEDTAEENDLQDEIKAALARRKNK